ncbi:MAG TPA: type I-U CRISPR-associated protein Cas8c, partial [Nannocystis exedens]|nr:type I-U CRISPR-associated protein Cas8c [Nannocystis exedens]
RYCYGIKQPESPATLVAALRARGVEIILDYWGDASRRDNVKFWAGAGGYPAVALLRDALELVRPLPDDAVADPFSVSASQKSSFRFDWRRDYVPIEIGFSLNAHTHIQPRGFPLVEILAAIGMSHARPQRPSRDKLLYRYSILGGHDLPLNLLRPALGCAAFPFPTRTFRIHLDWPGKAGQARCITDVVEEISA